jgi:hypothetical protein
LYPRSGQTLLKLSCLSPSISTFEDKEDVVNPVNIGGMELGTIQFILLENVGAEFTYVKGG